MAHRPAVWPGGRKHGTPAPRRHRHRVDSATGAKRWRRCGRPCAVELGRDRGVLGDCSGGRSENGESRSAGRRRAIRQGHAKYFVPVCRQSATHGRRSGGWLVTLDATVFRPARRGRLGRRERRNGSPGRSGARRPARAERAVASTGASGTDRPSVATPARTDLPGARDAGQVPDGERGRIRFLYAAIHRPSRPGRTHWPHQRSLIIGRNTADGLSRKRSTTTRKSSVRPVWRSRGTFPEWRKLAMDFTCPICLSRVKVC